MTPDLIAETQLLEVSKLQRQRGTDLASLIAMDSALQPKDFAKHIERLNR